jgi:thiamine biosynthesis lipoprotein
MFYQREVKIIPALFLILILCVCVVSSCSGISVQNDSFFTMDTYAEITVITRDAKLGREANAGIKEICGGIENRISHMLAASEIYKLNEALTTWAIPDIEHIGLYYIRYDLTPETAKLLETAKYMREQTNGAYNPNLGEIIDLWGINKKIPDEERKLPERADFFPALERAQINNYEIRRDGEDYYIWTGMRTKFDLGGIGKGYALDEISDYLVETGISHALVNLGESSILAAGRNRAGNLWSIGIRDPLDRETLCGVLNASDKIIAISGGYQRYVMINGIKYAHIIDPETGYPVDNDLLCVIVVMPSQSALNLPAQNERLKNNGAVSDALSTALYVMGKDGALSFYHANIALDFEMILFVKDEDSPRGYDVIATNVMFTKLDWLD